MSTLPLLTALALLGVAEVQAPEAAASPQQVRQAVERALPYLDKDGVGWWEQKKCVTCHQIPIYFRSQYEAQKRGFTINQKSLEGVRAKVLAQMEKTVPTGDKTRLVTDSAPILIWGISAGDMDDKSKEVFQNYVSLFVKVQKPEGSWWDPSLHWKGKELDPYPPLIESDAVKTMWTLLAGNQVSRDKEEWAASRDKALAWLKKTPPSDSHQERVLRLVVARQFGTRDDVQPLLKELMSLQQADGGWSQAKNAPSDALATGQSLYAIAEAGAGNDPAVRKAWGFLLKTQCADGSWHVATRNKGKPQASESGYVPSYYGTGWAVIGMVRTLPE